MSSLLLLPGLLLLLLPPVPAPSSFLLLLPGLPLLSQGAKQVSTKPHLDPGPQPLTLAQTLFLTLEINVNMNLMLIIIMNMTKILPDKNLTLPYVYSVQNKAIFSGSLP